MAQEKEYNVVQYRKDPDFLFEIGLKYFHKKQFGKARKYLEKAAVLNPYNAEYQFNFACALAEMRDHAKSTEVLLGIIINIDPVFTECYFGIACNYFEMGDMKRAREFFEKYIYFDIDGQFVDEAYDILYYLQIYDDIGGKTQKGKISSRLITKGEKFFEQGLYEKACAKFEQAVEADPQLVPLRNSFAMACYRLGDIDKAISLSHSVLRLESGNVTANCHLLLYYADKGLKEEFFTQLKAVSALGLKNSESLVQLLEVLQHLATCADKMEILSGMDISVLSSQQILEALVARKFTHDSIKKGIIRALKTWGTGETCQKEINLTDEDKVDVSTVKFNWKKEWEAVIDCALQNREYTYKKNYGFELKNIWISFVKSTSPAKVPEIKKMESWAAALEYIYCTQHFIKISKTKLAQKYKISPTSITNVLKELKL